MPLSFEVISRLMVVLAIALVAIPLIRLSGAGRGWVSVSLSALFLFLGSAVAYPFFSNWHWPEGGTVTASQAVANGDLETLIAAAQATPDEPGVWAALASALLSEQRPADAVGPLEQVYKLTNGSNVEWTLLLVDALMMTDDSARERVNEMVEGMLVIAPMHPKALYYGAELAFSRDDLGVARSRWQLLLERAASEDSPEAQQVREVLAKRIALVDQRLGSAVAEPPVATVDPGPALTLQVSLDPQFAARVKPSDSVFILARDGPGPPVAVVRKQVSELPFEVVLTDANAMLPSRTLSNFEQVEVVARVSLSGAPVAQSGDIFGQIELATDTVASTALVMSRVTP